MMDEKQKWPSVPGTRQREGAKNLPGLDLSVDDMDLSSDIHLNMSPCGDDDNSSLGETQNVNTPNDTDTNISNDYERNCVNTSSVVETFEPFEGFPDTSHSTETPNTSDQGDTVYLEYVPLSYTYHDLLMLFSEFGRVTRIRIRPENEHHKCFVTFESCEAARKMAENINTLPEGFYQRATLYFQRNIEDQDNDYVPNSFQFIQRKNVNKEEPLPQWFVAYYNENKNNFIKAYQFIQREIGFLAKEKVKRYGRGVLIHTTDPIQARMLLNMKCSADSMFQRVMPHKTFNHVKGLIFSSDLHEFYPDEIKAMCPDSVAYVTKFSGKAILLTFYGNYLPDNIYIDPIVLKVKPYRAKPMQCLNCMDYGHPHKYCKEAHSRCGRCSSVSHSREMCDNDEEYCFHCSGSHSPTNKSCPRYKKEEEILDLADRERISIGDARRRLNRQTYSSAASSSGPKASRQSKPSQTNEKQRQSNPTQAGTSKSGGDENSSQRQSNSTQAETSKSGGEGPTLTSPTRSTARSREKELNKEKGPGPSKRNPSSKDKAKRNTSPESKSSTGRHKQSSVSPKEERRKDKKGGKSTSTQKDNKHTKMEVHPTGKQVLQVGSLSDPLTLQNRYGLLADLPKQQREKRLRNERSEDDLRSSENNNSTSLEVEETCSKKKQCRASSPTTVELMDDSPINDKAFEGINTNTGARPKKNPPSNNISEQSVHKVNAT